MPTVGFWQLTAGFVGGCIGGVAAWFLEIEGFSPLAIYFLLGSWLGAWLATEDKGGPVFEHTQYFYISQKKSAKTLLLLIITLIYFGFLIALGINPRNFAYLPLVPLIIACTRILGFDFGFMATVISAGIADYFYIPALHSLRVDQAEDAIGLLAFIIAGSILAFGISKIFFSKR